MSEPTFDPDAIVEAVAKLHGFELTLESRAQVVVHLKIAADHAKRLFASPVDDAEEPAPVFTP